MEKTVSLLRGLYAHVWSEESKRTVTLGPFTLKNSALNSVTGFHKAGQKEVRINIQGGANIVIS